jgi:hypothetical protein
MTRLVDVVNFNADASCLAAGEWLAILEGGSRSRLCSWLQHYVRIRRPVVLGFVGGAIADIASFNPEAIALINANRDVIEPVLRPFSHDIGLLRSARGFDLNMRLGRAVARREFSEVVEFFLPPEFMLTNSQVKVLADAGIAGVFLNATRFKEETRDRIPRVPFMLEGVLQSRLPCIPFQGALTKAYLDALHAFDATSWNEAIATTCETPIFTWRDGESCFLIPDGNERERVWLEQESIEIRRETLSSALRGLTFKAYDQGISESPPSYPVHSFSAWFKEFRMLGFLGRLQKIEDQLDSLPSDLAVLWLQVINSDILSAVEKDSPVVSLKAQCGSVASDSRFTIWRSERGFEGEDYLALLETALIDRRYLDQLSASTRPHLRKLYARLDYARALGKEAAT